MVLEQLIRTSSMIAHVKMVCKHNIMGLETPHGMAWGGLVESSGEASSSGDGRYGAFLLSRNYSFFLEFRQSHRVLVTQKN